MKRFLLLIAGMALAVGLVGSSAHASADAGRTAQAAMLAQTASTAKAPALSPTLHPPGKRAPTVKSMKGLDEKRIATRGKRLLTDKRTRAFRKPFSTRGSKAKAKASTSAQSCVWYYFGNRYWGCFWYGGYASPANWWYVYMYYEGYGWYGQYYIYWDWYWPNYYWYGPYYY